MFRVRFLTEVLIIEITVPAMLQLPEPRLYDVPQLQFEQLLRTD